MGRILSINISVKKGEIKAPVAEARMIEGQGPTQAKGLKHGEDIGCRRCRLQERAADIRAGSGLRWAALICGRGLRCE